ncbi:multidrug effflux MFS transporter [Serinicoccus kebangsaanensis]|uniref:multidrug effflux MFS transporter n=1 Tax=Serinicoccus kebangsaanensis TaxID=2602069 RepID=UPI00124BE6A6|nr:multidrug effflux MFS transporter [Serinicoccus kebangsaanensis]
MTSSPPQPQTGAAAYPRRATLLVTTTLAALAMIGPFTIDTIFPGFEAIGRDFDADAAALQQITSIYLLSFAVMSIFHGPISDALGRKPVMVGGLLGYVLASVVCALAPTLGVLLVARVFQGLFAGAATIVSRAVIRDLFSGAEAQRLMARVMMIFAIAPAIAPVIGGEILRFGPWHWIFWFVAAYGIAAAVLTAVVLPETHPRERRSPLRVGSVLGSLWQVARSGRFQRVAFSSAFVFASYFLYVVAAPIVVVDLLGRGEQDFWMLFVPMIGGMVTGSMLTNRLAGRVDSGRMVDATMAGLLTAVGLNVLLCAVAPVLPWAVLGPAAMGIAIGVAFPVQQLAMLDLFPEQRGAAASMASFAALVFNALLAGAIAPLVTGSLLTAAGSSACLALAGAGLWAWHRRATAGDAPPG